MSDNEQQPEDLTPKKELNKEEFVQHLKDGLAKMVGAPKPEDEQAPTGFDISKFLPDTGNLLTLPTVSSNSSPNVYTCVASKDSSLVGVSITLEPYKADNGPGLQLVTRYLEVPPATGVSVFENSGEERPYMMDGVTRNVYMLRKETMPLCDARVSPWEVRYHLDAGVSEQLTTWVSDTLKASGCAINCNEEHLLDILFSRLHQLADTPAFFWKSLSEFTAKSL